MSRPSTFHRPPGSEPGRPGRSARITFGTRALQAGRSWPRSARGGLERLGRDRPVVLERRVQARYDRRFRKYDSQFTASETRRVLDVYTAEEGAHAVHD